MTERLKKLPIQLLDIWKKFTNKQKVLVISVACAVVLAFALMIFLMGRVDYTQLKVCENAKELSEVVDLLDAEGYKNKYDENTFTVYVDSKYSSKALLLLAKNDIRTDRLSMEMLLDNSIQTTNTDRMIKLHLFITGDLSDGIREMEGIDDVRIDYVPKESSDNIFTDDTEDIPVSVMLTVNDDFKPESAETIANAVASAIGNQDAKKVMVADQYGNFLYGGDEDLYSGISLKNTADYKEKLRNTFINNLYGVLIKNDFDDAEIAPHLEFDMNVVEELYKEYSAPEGMEQGLYTYSKNSKSENNNSSDGGVPGTSSNDGITYEMPDANASSSSSESSEYQYSPNEKQTNTKYEVGAVLPEESSVSIVLTRVDNISQESLQKDGALNGITFEEYAKQNSRLQPLTVDPSLIPLVSNATGVPEDKITITAFIRPVFIPTVKTPRSLTDYLQIALVVLIVGLLIFVVFKSVRPVEVTELEPELSVEQLLATTKENQSIEDIEFNEVSEVRRMIEKFVDEKPEAVAQLLRNWLNEDWS